MQTYLIGMHGYPGSGKTFFSRNLCERNNWLYLSSDRIRRKTYPEPTYTKDESRAVFGFMDYLAEEALSKGISVVYDANFNFASDREKLEGIATRQNSIHALVHIQTPEDVAFPRTQSRHDNAHETEKDIYRPITKEVYEELKAEMEPLGTSDRVIAINGTAEFEDQFRTFMKNLALL